MPPIPAFRPVTTNERPSDPLCSLSQAFTPAAYASTAARVSGESASRSRAAAGGVGGGAPPGPPPRRGSPTEGPDEPILRERAGAEQLRQATGRDVAPDLHLPHPLLGVDVALGEEEVVRRVGQDPRDPGGVAVDPDGLVEAGDGD